MTQSNLEIYRDMLLLRCIDLHQKHFPEIDVIYGAVSNISAEIGAIKSTENDIDIITTTYRYVFPEYVLDTIDEKRREDSLKKSICRQCFGSGIRGLTFDDEIVDCTECGGSGIYNHKTYDLQEQKK